MITEHTKNVLRNPNRMNYRLFVDIKLQPAIKTSIDFFSNSEIKKKNRRQNNNGK